MTSLPKYGMSIAFPVLLVLSGVLYACAATGTGSYADGATNFNEYHSFSWINGGPYISTETPSPVSALASSMIESGIRKQLELQGYAFTEAEESADLSVAYTVGTRDNIKMDSYPVGYRGHWGWHDPRSHYYFRKVSAENYTQGTLGVDIFDNETGKPVWHGWAGKVVMQTEQADPDSTIEKGMTKLFNSFPR